MNIRLNRLGLLALAVAAVLSFASPGHAAVVPSDKFTFAIVGFASGTGSHFILGNDYTGTFGTTQTFSGAGYDGQDYTVTSSEVVGANTTTDTFKVSTPANFLNEAVIQGISIDGLALTVGDSNSGVNIVGGPNPINFASPVGASIVGAHIVYGAANTVFSFSPAVALAADGLSIMVDADVSNSGNPIATLAVHEFDITITYPNPISTLTTITTSAPLHGTYGQGVTIGTDAAAGSGHPDGGSITCTLQPQPTGTATIIGPVAIDTGNGSAQCAVPTTQPAGSYTVTATYGGDATGPFGASSSAAAALTIAAAALTITPTAGQTKVYGAADPAAFAYTSSGLIGTSTLSGALGRAPGENAGNYAYTLGSLAVSDASNYALGVAPGNTFTITPAASSVTLSSPCSAVFVGGGNEPYLLTATVSPASVSGTVTFSVGGNAVCSNVPLSAGSAICVVNNLSAQGSDPIDTLLFSAAYNGNANTMANSGTSSAQVISAAEAILRNGFEGVVAQCPIE